MRQSKYAVERAVRKLYRTHTAREIAAEIGAGEWSVRQTLSRLKLTALRDHCELVRATVESLVEQIRRSALTQKEFARQLGVSPRVLESWLYERGVPASYARLIHLAATLVASQGNYRRKCFK